ncbi:MAG: hypothetical protein K0Q72_838 [Armatimonadetes bacterium]|jgi:hypothetical protein|nr:hypothetical protein [Armatimonadota bacterium]
MAVSIGLSRVETTDDAGCSAGVFLDDDGYYWFLYPFFERVEKQTGQMVDLYGNAVFAAEQLPLLLAALDAAVASTEQQAGEWAVLVGWRDGDPLYCTVSKDRLQGILANFITLVKLALATGRDVVAFGD